MPSGCLFFSGRRHPVKIACLGRFSNCVNNFGYFILQTWWCFSLRWLPVNRNKREYVISKMLIEVLLELKFKINVKLNTTKKKLKMPELCFSGFRRIPSGSFRKFSINISSFLRDSFKVSPNLRIVPGIPSGIPLGNLPGHFRDFSQVSFRNYTTDFPTSLEILPGTSSFEHSIRNPEFLLELLHGFLWNSYRPYREFPNKFSRRLVHIFFSGIPLRISTIIYRIIPPVFCSSKIPCDSSRNYSRDSGWRKLRVILRFLPDSPVIYSRGSFRTVTRSPL